MFEMDAYEGLELLGKNSKWHVRTYLLYNLGAMVSLPLMAMSPVFLGESPEYRCAMPDDRPINESIPQTCSSVGDNCQYDSCRMYSDSMLKNETAECQYGYWYNPKSGYESTLVTEFDLTCGNAWLVELSMMVNKLGCMFGFTMGILSDKWGRKKVLLLSCWSNTLIALAQAFAPNIHVYTVLSFFDGISEQGMLGSGIVMILEIYPRSQHSLVGVGFWMLWALGYIALVPFVYFIRHWRYLQIAITLPMIFFSIIYIWFIDESIPWLVTNNKRKKAEKILQKAAKFSGIKLTKAVFISPIYSNKTTGVNKQNCDLNMALNKERLLIDSIQHDTTETLQKQHNCVQHLQHHDVNDNVITIVNKLNCDRDSQVTQELLFKNSKPNSTPINIEDGNLKESTDYQLWDLFKYKKLLMYSVILWFIWFVNSMCYGAITATVTYLPGNRYHNLFFYAASEIPSYLALYFCMNRWGKRVPTVIFHILGGIALLACLIQATEWGQDNPIAIVIFSQIGKFCYTYTFGAIYLIPPEIYPTNFRGTGLAICDAFGRVGQIISPFFRILSREVPWLPTVIYGVTSIVAGLSLFILPETKDRPLPETMSEIEHYNEKKIQDS